MIAGAIPFKIYFLLYHGKVSKIFANRILAIFLTIALAGAVAASASLLFSGKYDLAEAIRFGAFSAVSGLCTCGLGNNFLHVWPVLSLSILILLTVIGGTMGSTAGGIKVNRVVLAYEGVKWWFRRFFVSSRVVVPFRSYKRNLSNRISDLAIAQNMLVIVVYVLTVFVATILIFHLYITSFRVEEVVFEIVSALSNSGLTTGFISEASPVTVKWVFIFLMWLGRLEIVPVVLILMGAVRAFQDSGSGGSNSQLN
jgi:trk system potassium uptake protein TrkH